MVYISLGTSGFHVSGVYASAHPASPDCRTSKGFQDNPLVPSPDMMIVLNLRSLRTDPMTPTPQVLSAPSLWSNTTLTMVLFYL
jgi:hypothetical protein